MNRAGPVSCYGLSLDGWPQQSPARFSFGHFPSTDNCHVTATANTPLPRPFSGVSPVTPYQLYPSHDTGSQLNNRQASPQRPAIQTHPH